MTKLYEISNQYLEILDKINEDGIMDDAAIATLDALEENFEEKASAVASYIKNLEHECAGIQDAIESMRDRELKLISKIVNLKDYLRSQMERCGINKISSNPYFEIAIKKCPAAVDVYNETLVPREFWEQTIIEKINKNHLRNAIKDGLEIEGARITQRTRLEIK